MLFLCRLADLEATGAKEIMVGDAGIRRAVFVVKHAHGVAAYFNACPHARLPLNNSPDAFLDTGRAFLVCVNHGAHFDPATGRCMRGPCKGAGLKPFPIRCDGDGIFCAESDYTFET